MAKQVPPFGSKDAEIVIVGEAPGAQEELAGKPFVGASGQLLTDLLMRAGIRREDCYITNVFKTRPPNNEVKHFFEGKQRGRKLGLEPLAGRYVRADKLAEIEALREEMRGLRNARVIIALGATALWALTGREGIGAWRGSIIQPDPHEAPVLPPCPVVPTYHPAAILREMSLRPIAIMDLGRARALASGEISPPNYHFHIRPSFEAVMEHLRSIKEGQPIAVDIETMGEHIVCIGVATSEEHSFVIPLWFQHKHYYAEHEEYAIKRELRAVLQRAFVIGQNFAYDAQYLARDLLTQPKCDFDTMVAQSVLYAGMPKSLDFLSSMWLPWHEYWKEEGKTWKRIDDWDGLLAYNARDCVITFAVAQRQQQRLAANETLLRVFNFQMKRLWPAVVRMMMRGINVDKAYRSKLLAQLMEENEKLEKRLHYIVGYPLNPRSTPQMRRFIVEEMGCKPVRSRKTGRESFGAETLPQYAKQQPVLRPIVDIIERMRQNGTYISTYLCAELDHDGRFRTFLDIAGTETFRFASRKNVFGRGGNLQNVPRVSDDAPNLRKLFIPDPGYIIVDMDLDRADAQVVAWEADDEELKQMFREGVDIHAENAKVLGCSRTMAKQAVHATNYGVGPRTMASILGITQREAEQFRKRWFEAHPRIKEWHRRVEAQMVKRGYVENRFGYRRPFYGRIKLPEGLAWIPQSTVACVINRILVNIYEQLPEVQLLLQVHDSLVFQVRKAHFHTLMPRILELARVVVPYDDPLIIPVSYKVSEVSWGECK